MSGFPIVDLVVGMMFVYFLLSIISSSGVEMIMTAGNYRAKMLEKWLMGIFNKDVQLADKTSVKLGQAIMDHCSLNALSEKGHATSYIDARNFTSALLEKITYDPNNPDSVANSLDDFISYIKKTKALPSDLQRLLLGYATEAKETFKSASVKTESEIDLFSAKIEDWFNSNMDRVGGSLKTKYSRPFTLVVATVTIILLNADSVSIAKYLYSNPDTRTKLAAQAVGEIKDSTFQKQFVKFKARQSDKGKDTASMEQIDSAFNDRLNGIKKAKATLDDSILLGWRKNELADDDGSFSLGRLFSKIIGLIATILATMMGAPFWFDQLNKISNIRGTGKKPQNGNT